MTIDLTAAVLEEAVEFDADLIIAYHPPIFSGIKRFTAAPLVQRATAAGYANTLHDVRLRELAIQHSTHNGNVLVLSAKCLMRLRSLRAGVQCTAHTQRWMPRQVSDCNRCSTFHDDWLMDQCP